MSEIKLPPLRDHFIPVKLCHLDSDELAWVHEYADNRARAAVAAYLEKHGEPEYWQWRRKSQPWSLDKTFNSRVYATADDSEVRPLYTAPQPTPQERQDAARYRRIRWYAVARGYMPKDWDRVLRDTRATDADFDAVVDAAMSKEPS